MPGERISIQNFLRASENFLQDLNHYSASEQVLLHAMLSRLSERIHKAEETADLPGHIM
jgi:uncharacterized phage infection (PIP) family protein YhgE